MSNLSRNETAYVIQNAIEGGVNFFDHADMYGEEKSEEIFAEAIEMSSAVREKIFLQSKTGIRKDSFDFSK